MLTQRLVATSRRVHDARKKIWQLLFPLLFLLILCAPLSTRAQHFNCSGRACIPSESKRVVLNTDFADYYYDYAFINFFNENGGLAPYSSGFKTGTVWNSSILDANGYPCTNQINTSCPYASTPNPAQGSNGFGGTFSVPASTSYSGPYCVQGYGTGTMTLYVVGAISLSAVSGQTCANFNGGATACDGASHFTNSGTVSLTSLTFTMTDEHWLGWCIAVAWSGPRYVPGFQLSNDDKSNTGHYLKGLEWYEQADGPDLVAGKIFRRAYKAPIVALDPAALRTMNDLGGNNSPDVSFVSRALPGASLGFGQSGASVWGNLLPYGASTGTNILTVAAVAGTPASMTHGEVVRFRAGSSSTPRHAAYTVRAVTVPMPGTVQVTTSAANGFSLGDVVVMYVAGGFSTNVLNLYPATIINIVDATDFQFNLANTGLVTTCPSSAICNTTTSEYACLDVGGRGCYPAVFYTANVPYLVFDDFVAGNYYTFCFNKNIQGYSDGAGKVANGVWISCSANTGATPAGRPIEILVDLVNELNAMGPKYPINLWMMIPPMAITCNTYYCDPDATTSTEWPANAVNVAMNGASGYLGLNVPAQLIIQAGCNECWNGAWGQSQQLAHRGYWRWHGSTTDLNSFSELLSLWQITDIKQSPYMSTRVHFVDGGWMDAGSNPGNYNYDRVTGSALLSTGDPQNPLGNTAPITAYDWGYALSPYVQTGAATANADIGTALNPGTTVSAWIGYVQSEGYAGADAINTVNRWVTGPLTSDVMASIDRLTMLMDENATLTSTGTVNNGSRPYGKPTIGYEGYVCGNAAAVCAWVYPAGITALSCTAGTISGTFAYSLRQSFSTGQSIAINDTSVAAYNNVFTLASVSGRNFTIIVGSCPSSPRAGNWQGYYGSADDVVSAFNLQVYFSSAWATADAAFFSTLAANQYIYMPPLYLEFANIWGFSVPDAYGPTNTEGGGFAPSWTALSAYDSQQQNFLLNRDLPGHPANDDRAVGLNEAA